MKLLFPYPTAGNNIKFLPTLYVIQTDTTYLIMEKTQL